MEDREKILRWDLQEANQKLAEDGGEVPLVSMAFAIMEIKRENAQNALNNLNEYLSNEK